MNIYEKILAIMESVQRLEKDTKVEFGTTNYSALSEEKVTTIMRDQMVKQKLVVFPTLMTASRVGQLSHVDVLYKIVNVENPEEFIEVASCGDGADSQDKGAGKAMTYAYKYMWLRTFALPTGDDPDKIASDAICAKCGGEIRATEKATAAELADYTERTYGKRLCETCAKAERARRSK